MTHDLVIRGGEIADGTGKERYLGDLAIDEGVISAIGDIDGRGREEIDAGGCIVSPGFIDLHTHLDAQIGWDPMMTPLSWHGVTTALMGNCGVTFAPCKPDDRELLAGMMETVENIPKDAILTGLPWDWEDYGGYLDTLERLQPAMNVCGLVGHCAVRYYVMGERAVEEQSTESERKEMADIVGRSIDRGAMGFSTNRYAPHKLPDGRSIPGTFADPEELVEIGKAIGQRDGLVQAVGATFDVIKTMSDTTGGRVLFSYGVGPEKGSGRAQADHLEQLCQGRDVTAITQVRGSGHMFGLQWNIPVQGESWDKLRALDLAGRLDAIRDTEMATRLVAEARQQSTNWIPMNQVYYMGHGEVPEYAATQENNLKAIADAAGEHWSETFLRLCSESDGKGYFNFRMFNQNMEELGDLFRSEHIFPGLGDTGAHVSQIMDAGWASFTLSHWVREAGVYSLEEGIRRITSAPARVIGLTDRGTLSAGQRADINVFEADEVAELQPEIVHDFPGGAPRFIQQSKGYRNTIVNGQISFVNGESTGIRAGAVLRHQS